MDHPLHHKKLYHKLVASRADHVSRVHEQQWIVHCCDIIMATGLGVRGPQRRDTRWDLKVSCIISVSTYHQHIITFRFHNLSVLGHMSLVWNARLACNPWAAIIGEDGSQVAGIAMIAMKQDDTNHLGNHGEPWGTMSIRLPERFWVWIWGNGQSC